MQPKKISRQMLKRLPIYLNHIKSLPEGTQNISATAIARALDMGDVQVRKDLARISDGGRCRTGHPREKLIRDIENFLDYATPTAAVVVGVGKLGQALLDYSGFSRSGLDVLAGFDICPDADISRHGKPIYPIDRLASFCRERQVQIGILTVPEEEAQEVCDRMVACGIRAIWNFVPVYLKTPDHVLVQSEDLAISASALRVQMINCNSAEAG